MQLFTPFVNFAKVSQTETERTTVVTAIPDEKYNMPVEDLDLSVRTMNSLRRGGITTVGELISKGEKELLSLRNFGQKSRQEVEERLAALGLKLAASGSVRTELTEGGESAEGPDESDSAG
jgi:DNA-directed RNA polymerase subunit alpha